MEEAGQGCSVLVLLLLSFSPVLVFVVGAALFKCREQVAQANRKHQYHRKQARARALAKAKAKAEAAAEASRKKSDMDLHMTAWDTRSAPAASMAVPAAPATRTVAMRVPPGMGPVLRP